MRSSVQKWNQIVARFEVVIAGVGSAGLTPTVGIQRVSDSKWLQGGGTWGAGFASLSMTEPDSTNLPGYYEYAVPTGSLDYSAGKEGYLIRYVETTIPLVETEQVEQQALFAGEVGCGAVASATSTTVTFDTWAPASASRLLGLSVTIISGTGSGQTRTVTAYTAGRAASVFPAWGTTPDNTSVAVVHGPGSPAGNVWLTDVEALFGGSGGLNLPPTDVRQQYAGGLLHAAAEANVQGFTGATFWRTSFVSSALGTTAKFYFTSTEGPAVADSAYWADKYAVWIVASTGARRLVKITAVATDGSVHFALTLPDGSVLPAAPAAGDRLVVLQGYTGASLTVADIFTASMSGYETAGTFGNHVNRMLRLRQENTRVVYTAWASNGQPTAGYVLTYASAADLNADTDPWALAKARHDFTATYDVDLQLTGYESVKTS